MGWKEGNKKIVKSEDEAGSLLEDILKQAFMEHFADDNKEDETEIDEDLEGACMHIERSGPGFAVSIKGRSNAMVLMTAACIKGVVNAFMEQDELLSCLAYLATINKIVRGELEDLKKRRG